MQRVVAVAASCDTGRRRCSLAAALAHDAAEDATDMVPSGAEALKLHACSALLL